MNIPNKKLGFGLMRLPLLDPTDYKSIDKENSKKMIDTFINQGFTYFDTAYVYHGGMSERLFGELVSKRYPRSAFTVTTKMPIFIIEKIEDYERIFNEQLERCCVDYFDYYFLHSLNRNSYDEKVQPHKAFEFIAKKKAEGKIKHIGFSFHDNAETLDRILTDHPEVELVQLQINYIDWDSASIESRKCYEVCVKHNKKVAVMEPLKGGKLINIPEDAKKAFKESSNLSIASWGIRYAASLENVIIVLSGMSNMEQLIDNTSYMVNFERLTEEEYRVIERVVKIINDAIAIQCTDCKYCIDGCPMNIAIPRYFALYNNVCQFGKLKEYKDRFNNLKEKFGAPSACIECGQCESVCPQHLKIIDLLKVIDKEFN